MADSHIGCTTTWIKMTGYNARLSFFGFKLIELTPKLIKYGIKIENVLDSLVGCFMVKSIHEN